MIKFVFANIAQLSILTILPFMILGIGAFIDKTIKNALSIELFVLFFASILFIGIGHNSFVAYSERYKKEYGQIKYPFVYFLPTITSLCFCLVIFFFGGDVPESEIGLSGNNELSQPQKRSTAKSDNR